MGHVAVTPGCPGYVSCKSAFRVADKVCGMKSTIHRTLIDFLSEARLGGFGEDCVGLPSDATYCRKRCGGTVQQFHVKVGYCPIEQVFIALVDNTISDTRKYAKSRSHSW